MLKSIKLNNFELFKTAEVNLGKINIVSGVNKDDAILSSNGSGKSTLAKNALLFGLYGEVSSINLKDLIRIGEKEASVELVINKGQDAYRIIRTIPSSLTIYKNDKELEGNTLSIKQKYINDVFGELTFFRKFRMIDNQGINLLDLGITGLRKELMNFVDDLFTGVRQNLLSEKLKRETYSYDKRLYKFYLSDKKLQILEKGIEDLKQNLKISKENLSSCQTNLSNINSEITANKRESINLSEKHSNNLTYIRDNNKYISESKRKQTFTADVTEIENERATAESLYQSLYQDRELLKKTIENFNMEIFSINEKIKHNNEKQVTYNLEIKEINSTKIGAKCDKCGSIIDEKHKESYKNEKEIVLQTEKTEEERLIKENKQSSADLAIKKEELRETEKMLEDLKRSIDENTKLLKSINIEKAENIKLVTLVESYERNNKTLQEENNKIDIKIKELHQSLYNLQEESIKRTEQLDLKNKEVELFSNRIQKSQEYFLKLKEAFKFIDYKYTPKDVMLYTEAIKVLDSFAGYYINEWLTQLSIIMNDLLKNVNMKVQFSAEKDFIKIKNGDNELKYEMLSSGQKTFLSSVFKLSILLHRGENSGLIICDEGLSSMDEINFLKFMEICKTLPYQYVIIFHGLKTEIEDINKIEVVRQNGESKIK